MTLAKINLLCILKYRKNPAKIPTRILQTQWFIHSIFEKKIPMILLWYFSIWISPFSWLPYPLKSLEHINISQPLPMFSRFQEPSTSTKVMEKIFKVNAWTSMTSPKTCHQHWQPPSPTPKKATTGYIHHTNHSTRCLFLHTTLLQTKTMSKTRIQFQNHNSKVQTLTPKTTPSTDTLQHEGILPNYKIPKLTRGLSPTPLMWSSFIPPTPEKPPKQTHMPSIALSGIIPQKPRDMTICTTF